MAKFFRVYASPGALASVPVPLTNERYAYVQSLASLFSWNDDSTATADSVNTIAPTSGGVGRWMRVVEDTAGSSLSDADATIGVAGGKLYTLPASTLGANRTLTLDDAGAIAGDVIEITRLDVGAYTVTIVNGGASAGTICTMPVSARSFAALRFDGSDWRALRSGLML